VGEGRTCGHSSLPLFLLPSYLDVPFPPLPLQIFACAFLLDDDESAVRFAAGCLASIWTCFKSMLIAPAKQGISPIKASLAGADAAGGAGEQFADRVEGGVALTAPQAAEMRGRADEFGSGERGVRVGEGSPAAAVAVNVEPDTGILAVDGELLPAHPDQ
jgi:hypothetical protein